jgi:hypothetical protein
MINVFVNEGIAFENIWQKYKILTFVESISVF